jgi:translocation and assembly module TamB
LYLPHGLDAINGTLSFDAGGIRVDDVRATVGRGEVVFAGRIGMEGFLPSDLNLTATGTRMNIRYIEGFPAVVDAELALRGPFTAPVLSGTVTVRDALWSRRFEATPDILELATGERGPIGAPAEPSAVPLRLDIHVIAPGTLRIENNLARVRASADLRLGGTIDRPQLFGRAEIVRGDLVFEGNRYTITRGSLDFTNPLKIDPYLDLEAETRVRMPGGPTGSSQTYRVTISLTGTANQFNVTTDSDPPLPLADIVSLLLGQPIDPDADLRLRNPATAGQAEQELLKQLTARLLAGPIAGPVSELVESALGRGATVQIAPSFGTEADPLSPSARLIIGKRLSDRAYLTLARALGGTAAGVRDTIITVEYDQNDRVGFVLTQTGNNTFAVEFRVRHVF